MEPDHNRSGNLDQRMSTSTFTDNAWNLKNNKEYENIELYDYNIIKQKLTSRDMFLNKINNTSKQS